MTEPKTRIELERNLWRILEGKITEFQLELSRGERGDHLLEHARNWGLDRNLRIDGFVPRTRRPTRELHVFIVLDSST